MLPFAQGWFTSCQHRKSPNFNDRPDVNDVSLIVIHNISLPPGVFGGGYIEAFFNNELPVDVHAYFEIIQTLRVSSHLLIDRNGHLIQFVDINRRAWHAGASHFEGRDNCNDFSIGIELEGTDDLPFADAQYTTLTSVTQTLLHHYAGLSSQRIVGHSDIAPGRKTDPGQCFDWSKYAAMLGSKTVEC